MLSHKRNPDFSGKTKTFKLALALCIMLSLPFGKGWGWASFAQVANGTGAGNCLSFDGMNNNYVNIPVNNPMKPAAAISVGAWVNLFGFNPHQVIIGDFASLGCCTQNYGYGLSIGSDSKVYFTLAIAPSYQQVITTTSFPLNTWTHIIGVYDGTDMRVYINGVLANTPLAATGNIFYTTGSIDFDFRIGRDPNPDGNAYVPGLIDEVQVWNRALTETEIRDNMCKKLQGNEAGLVGYWRFDEGSGGTAYDASLNGNDGTLY